MEEHAESAPTEQEGASDRDTPSWVGSLKERGRVALRRLQRQITSLRERSTVVDVGFGIYDRDRDAGGTLLGSALALRLFLFFVPLLLFVVGLAGLVGRHGGYDSLSSDAGITGTIGNSIDDAFQQSSGASWLAALTGLFGMATTGWSLSRALVVSSALSWQLGGRQKVQVRAVGTVVGLIIGIGLITVILNRIRNATGVAVMSMSFLAVLGVYLVMWMVVFQALPRNTSDPSASLPGSALAATTLTGMQAVSVLYVPGAIERSSNLYGAIGVTVATLGWFFILGRVVVFAFSLNAVVYERIGSVSRLLFALPGVRAVPRRYPVVARYFDLDHVIGTADAEPLEERAPSPDVEAPPSQTG
jgi:uncharacterized BrkB/YihY/UPF0761 family membrane protein